MTVKLSLLVFSNPHFMCHTVMCQSWESAQAAWSKYTANEDKGSGMCKGCAKSNAMGQNTFPHYMTKGTLSTHTIVQYSVTSADRGNVRILQVFLTVSLAGFIVSLFSAIAIAK